MRSPLFSLSPDRLASFSEDMVAIICPFETIATDASWSHCKGSRRQGDVADLTHCETATSGADRTLNNYGYGFC